MPFLILGILSLQYLSVQTYSTSFPEIGYVLICIQQAPCMSNLLR